MMYKVTGTLGSISFSATAEDKDLARAAVDDWFYSKGGLRCLPRIEVKVIE